MQLVLKYILILFIIVLVKMPKGRDWGHKQTNRGGFCECLWQRTVGIGISCTSIKRLWKEKVDIGGANFSTPTTRYRTTVAL